jgi:protein O-mannosyl-transferase
MPTTNRVILARQFTCGLIFFAVLGTVLLLYLPGLSGSFLFDDFSNLDGLKDLGSDPAASELLQFLSHGISSPSGRPISLATFALQAADWPNSPEGFLRVNLLIHLLNGALLLWSFLIIGRLMQMPGRSSLYVPLIGATLWLVAPIQASAVLYVVQRMTELSATFVFSGMLLYLTGREATTSGKNPRVAGAWMSLGLLWGACLGVLAKENAVLMPLLVVVLEFTLLAQVPRPAFWKKWAGVFLGLPIAALVAYLLIKTSLLADGYALREFTAWQRLLTETRVLFLYLHKLLLPWPSAIRLLYDDFPASASLMEPWTTLASVLALSGLVGLALRLRKAAPWFAFALFWFLAAHLLESTVLPLELVFEHRNYQASAGVWFGVAAALSMAWNQASGAHFRTVLAGFLAAYLTLLSVVLWQISTLWGRPFEMAARWAQRQPDSKRARIEFIGALAGRGYPLDAAKVAEDAARHWPDDALLHFTVMQLACADPRIELPPLAETLARIRATRKEVLSTIHQMNAVMELIELGRCPRVAVATVREAVDAALENPRMQVQRQNLLLLRARALRREGRRAESRGIFRQAVEIKPVMILLLQGVVDEMDLGPEGGGELETARFYLRLAEADPRVSAIDRWSHRHDIALLQRWLADVEARETLRKIPAPVEPPVSDE